MSDRCSPCVLIDREAEEEQDFGWQSIPSGEYRLHQIRSAPASIGKIMAYEGDILNACGVIHIDLSEINIVAVSGDGPNICGHLLIHSAKDGGYYFHVTGDPSARGLRKARGYPMYMNDAGYRRYLKETGKSELRRKSLSLPNPEGALLYIEGLLAEKWTWAVLPNNCVSFVEEVIAAGGGSWSSYSNCPALATADSISQRMDQFYQWMESSIYEIYGVPR